MLSQLHTAARQFTRTLPQRIRALSTLENTPQDLPSASSLPLPADYLATPSQQSVDAYAFPSAAEEIQPILDIPPESDPLLAYLTSHLMRDGKRHAAARRTSRMLLHLHALTRAPPLPIFRDAVFRAAPSIRIVSHKKGGKNVQKPVPLGEKQRVRFAIKWMLTAAAAHRRGRTIEERLAREVLQIVKEGDPEKNDVLKKKQELHKLGMVNRCVVRVLDHAWIHFHSRGHVRATP